MIFECELELNPKQIKTALSTDKHQLNKRVTKTWFESYKKWQLIQIVNTVHTFEF